jgi:hypothetical protein
MKYLSVVLMVVSGFAFMPQANAQGFGGFGPTLPKCAWRKVVCGSALPGYPVPMCWEYYCYFPGSSRNNLLVE